MQTDGVNRKSRLSSGEFESIFGRLRSGFQQQLWSARIYHNRNIKVKYV